MQCIQMVIQIVSVIVCVCVCVSLYALSVTCAINNKNRSVFVWLEKILSFHMPF